MTTHRLGKLTSPIDDRSGERLSRYEYRGWIISKQIRDWDARGMGGNGWAGPKITWDTHKRFSRIPGENFDTVRAARTWIDAQENAIVPAPASPS